VDLISRFGGVAAAKCGTPDVGLNNEMIAIRFAEQWFEILVMVSDEHH